MFGMSVESVQVERWLRSKCKRDGSVEMSAPLRHIPRVSVSAERRIVPGVVPAYLHDRR